MNDWEAEANEVRWGGHAVLGGEPSVRRPAAAGVPPRPPGRCTWGVARRFVGPRRRRAFRPGRPADARSGRGEG